MRADWPLPSENGNSIDESEGLELVDPEADAKAEEEEAQRVQKCLDILKALRESGRAFTKQYMGDAEDAWLYTIGEKRFPAPANKAAREANKHMSRTVRNGMYAMMDHRVSFVTGAETKIIMKVLGQISELDRRKMESVLHSELDRLHWEEDALNTAWDAEVTKVGYTFFQVEPDPFTGERKIVTRVVDPSKVGVNKRATSPRDATFMTLEDTLPLSEIRRLWPDTGQDVKPLASRAIGMGEDSEYHTAHDDDTLLDLPGNEFIMTKEGGIVEQEATVYWGWIKDPEVVQVWEKAKNETPVEGYACTECMNEDGSDYQFMTAEENPACPNCGGEAVATEIPTGQAMAEYERKKYPFGRCIIGIPEQKILLYEGPNEVQLERVFPFARLSCYVKSRTYFGQSTYDMLKSNQKARDQNIGLLTDHLRYNAHPVQEIPESAQDAWIMAGNGPGARAYTPDDVTGQSRFLSGGAFDYQGWLANERALKADAEEITGVDEILTGGSPMPESGEAIKARQVARSKRIGGFQKRYDQYKTDYAAIVWELMTREYTEPRTFPIKGANNELTAITMTISELPYQVVVQVTSDPEEIQTDDLAGQNLGQFITSGAIFDPRLRPFMDDILTGLKVPPMKAESIQQKLNSLFEQAPAGSGIPSTSDSIPTNGEPGPPGPPQGEPMPPEMMPEEAMY